MSLPTSFLESSYRTRKEYEESLKLPDVEREKAEALQHEKAATECQPCTQPEPGTAEAAAKATMASTGVPLEARMEALEVVEED